MNAKSPLPRWFSSRHSAVGSTVLIALFGITPAATWADQQAATITASRATEVSLVDLDLSTPEGMRKARERLQTMARRVCGRSANELSSKPNFVTCVDCTVADALGHIKAAIGQSDIAIRDSVTRAGNVTLADLDLSTPEGFRVARKRLESMSRRLCDELTHSGSLSYHVNYTACVRDTLDGALEQAKVIAAAKQFRVAQRRER